MHRLPHNVMSSLEPVVRRFDSDRRFQTGSTASVGGWNLNRRIDLQSGKGTKLHRVQCQTGQLYEMVVFV